MPKVFFPRSSAGSSLRTPYSVVVRKSGSTFYAERLDGTSVASGTNPVTVINSAISDVSSSGGGTVFVSASCGSMSVSSSISLASGVRLEFESMWGRPGDAVDPTLYGARLAAAANNITVIDIPSAAVGAEVVRAVITCTGRTGVVGISSSSFDARIVETCIIDASVGVRMQTNLGQWLMGPYEMRGCGTCIEISATDCIVSGAGRLLAFTSYGLNVTGGGTQVAGPVHLTSGQTDAIGVRIQSQYPVALDSLIFDSVHRPIQLDGSYGSLIGTNLDFYSPGVAKTAAIYATAPGRIQLAGFRVLARPSSSTWTNFIRYTGSVGPISTAAGQIDTAAITGMYITDGSTELIDTNSPSTGRVTTGIVRM